MSRLLWPLLILLVAVLFLASLLIGPAGLGLAESLQALVTGQGGPVVLVMQEIRLPRAILGLCVGAALGLSGAAMQGFLRNPLAEPGLIGVSSTAALGAVISLQTGLAAAFTLAFAMIVVPALLATGDIPGAFAAGFVNPFSTGYSLDVILCAVLVILWVLYERRTLGIKHGWIAIPLCIVPGVAVGLAYYLILRPRSSTVK